MADEARGEDDEFARLLGELNRPIAGPAHAFPAQPSAPPELMGADQLAAPPRPVAPAPYAFAPAPSVASLAPSAPPPPGAAQVAPSSPAPSAGVSAPPATAAAAPPRADAPLDFAAVLATPVADGTPSGPASALWFGTGAPDVDEVDLERSTVGEKLVLILAIVLAPLGLIAGLIAAGTSVRRRGWVVGVVRASIAVGAVMTVVLGVGGYLGYTVWQQQVQHASVARASAAFCATLKADPTMLQSPTFGWPAVAGSIPDSLAAMQAYEDRWAALAKKSPAGIRPEVSKIADAAKQIIAQVTVARTVNDAANVQVMTSVASASKVPTWHAEYCT